MRDVQTVVWKHLGADGFGGRIGVSDSHGCGHLLGKKPQNGKNSFSTKVAERTPANHVWDVNSNMLALLQASWLA